MRYSKLFPKTLKEAPHDEVAINAKYLMRGGFIDKLMAGSYTLLPLGWRVIENINTIIREEMNATGAQEVLMPLLHPKDIWNETGRWDEAKDVMYQFEKNEKHFALSFTHEEIVMDLIRKHVTSYKDLPLAIYHFSTKFRNELRAKSGILRGREFMMKDLYSAHATEEDLMKYYWEVADAYLRVFKRVGIDAIITEASGGVFTKEHTHEFQAPCEVGEDTIYIADSWKHAKNDEVMTDGDRTAPGLKAIKSIEVGNIFPFGTAKYAEKMGGMFTDKDGQRKPVWFASYGIGPTRVMGTLVELFHDDRGIIWPESVAPYQVHLIGIMSNESGIKEKADKVYELLTAEGIEVLYDDREDVGPGQKFADCDLIGIPVRLVVSAKTGEQVEWKKRKEEKTELLSIPQILEKL
ncbi:MAG: aminoacyl--tRNA ligase-related protein [bacterium]|nr:aminoacyl--tRNA ligase-related protein [bacterium]